MVVGAPTRSWSTAAERITQWPLTMLDHASITLSVLRRIRLGEAVEGATPCALAKLSSSRGAPNVTPLAERSRYTFVLLPCCSLQATIARRSSETRAAMRRFGPGGSEALGPPGRPAGGQVLRQDRAALLPHQHRVAAVVERGRQQAHAGAGREERVAHKAGGVEALDL